jgi:hypothetical protein
VSPQPRRPHQVAHIDELDAVPGPGSLTWRPVRAHFGLRAFGCNAYTAEEPGVDVVEPHDEDEDAAHEELYFVARGMAEFRIDGESFDAPAGTYVFVPDPASNRHAVAREAGTTVLSFGGPPVFEPSAWEWSFRAAPLIESDPEEARRILDEGLQSHPGSPGLRLRLAEVELAAGNRDAALDGVREALGLHPDVAEWVLEDDAFPRLRADEEIAALLRS